MLIQRIVFAALVGVTMSACHSATHETSSELQIQNGRVLVPVASPFFKHLEVLALGAYETRSVEFQSVGKLIALANSSNELTGAATSWAELEPAITKSAQLHLGSEPVGTAYGVTSIAAELAKQIHLGQQVRIKHYRVSETGWGATIVRVVPNVDSGTADVVFRVSDGGDLYPGTTCEVRFPLLQAKALKVPATALVHEGLDEYIWQVISPSEFKLEKVTAVEGSSDDVLISSGVLEKSKIVGRGAILLKPLIRKILVDKGGSHVD